MFSLAWTRGGDSQEDSVTVQYDPPENLSPAECGALLANAVSPRDFTATIVDLSVKGYLAIELSDGGKEPGPNVNQDYVFHMIKQPSEWNSLKLHESAILRSIFLPMNPLHMLMDAMSHVKKGAENSGPAGILAKVQEIVNGNPRLHALSEAGGEARPLVTLSEAQNYFYLHKTELSEYVFDELVAGGYYASRPDRLRQFYVGAGIVTGMLLAVLGRYVPVPGALWYTWILSGVLTAAIIAGFGSFVPARSVTGARALGKVRGFVDFLGRVEKDHIERLERTPELFERYLPYAMALGVENKWAQAFGRITVQPKWHRGRGVDFFAPELVEGLSGMSNQTGREMNSTFNSTGAWDGQPERRDKS
jgi:Predicted membrane protein (DUF2207)